MPVLQVLIDEHGDVVGTAHAHANGSGAGHPDRVTLVARPGQRLQQVTVEDADAGLPPNELHARIKSKYLRT